MISAVDLLKGIAICAGMKSVDVEGATGYIDTNFDGKCKAAIDEFKNGADFVYIHVEAPDECGHRGEIENKVKAIELIDEHILKPVTDFLRTFDDLPYSYVPIIPHLFLSAHTLQILFLILSMTARTKLTAE